MADMFGSGRIPVTEWHRLVIEDHLAERGEFFNLHHIVRLKDDVDFERFAAALTCVYRSREATRARLAQDESGEWFIYDSGVEFPAIQVENFPAAAFDQLCAENDRAFRMTDSCFLRVRATRVGGEAWLFMCFHHGFIDNVSYRAIIEEVVRAYEAPGWVPESDGYFAWVRREHKVFAGRIGEEGRRFWTERREKFSSWPHAPRKDRDGSVDHSRDPQRHYFTLPFSGEALAAAAARLGTSVFVLMAGAFVRAVAADHGSDRALLGWTCHGRNAKTRRMCGAFLRDYDIGIETGGSVEDYLRRVRADLNAAMRHPYGYSYGRACYNDLDDDDLAFVNMRDENATSSLFLDDPRARYGGLADCSDMFELLLLHAGKTLSGKGFVKYMANYYSPARIADFLKGFFAELETLIA